MTPSSVMETAPPQALELEVRAGVLPVDLQGITYVVGATPRGEHPLFGGDGRVWRFAWEGAAGTVPMLSRDVSTWDKIQDDAHPGSFESTGYARSSEEFGYRSLANTALQPMGSSRLLVTADAGRAWEIDPTTLEALTPVGSYADWLWSAPHPVNPMIMTTAHPGWDRSAGRLFFAEIQMAMDAAGAETALYHSDVHVTVWDGEGPLQRWKVRGVHLRMCAHQVGLTREHVILADTNFLVEAEQAGDEEFCVPCPGPCDLYLVRRADLVPANRARGVEAVHVQLPVGVVHFVADWDDADGRITLHLVAPGPSDGSEWLRASDVLWHSGAPVRPELRGFLPSTVDVNAVARVVIDAATGDLVEQHYLSDDTLFWGVALYTRNEASTQAQDAPSALYWTSAGYDPDTLSRRMVELYADHDQRQIPVEALPTEEQPNRLLRIDTRELAVADDWDAPLGVRLASPVFIPRVASRHELDGYVQVFALKDDGDEVWLFDGTDLAAGPVCRLGHAELSLPWTLHTAWMPRATPRTSRYGIDPARDAALTEAAYPLRKAQMLKAWGPR